ncbi:MAG TPA: hypothetical protein VF120_00680 [Ktedonobacterales bacterium]
MGIWSVLEPADAELDAEGSDLVGIPRGGTACRWVVSSWARIWLPRVLAESDAPPPDLPRRRLPRAREAL